MRKEHLSRIRCPWCGGVLELASSQHEFPDRIIDGSIRCSTCIRYYPIRNGVPRLLLDGMDRTSHDTQDVFGYEWKLWKRLPDFAENHFFNVMQKTPEFFAGKSGWDAACGMGRDLQHASKAVGHEGFVLGSDISEAAESAYERCRHMDNVMVVQADLYSRIVPVGSMDFAYMIGVIQHLPTPVLGIRLVAMSLKPGGYFAGTVYQKPKDVLCRMVNAVIATFRLVSTRLPLPAVLWISRICAIPAYLFFKLPQPVLNMFGYVRSMNKLYPDHGTQNRKPDFGLLTHCWFDHFSPPMVRFFSDDEIRAMVPETLDISEMSMGILRGYSK